MEKVHILSVQALGVVLHDPLREVVQPRRALHNRNARGNLVDPVRLCELGDREGPQPVLPHRTHCGVPSPRVALDAQAAVAHPARDVERAERSGRHSRSGADSEVRGVVDELADLGHAAEDGGVDRRGKAVVAVEEEVARGEGLVAGRVGRGAVGCGRLCVHEAPDGRERLGVAVDLEERVDDLVRELQPRSLHFPSSCQLFVFPPFQ